MGEGRPLGRTGGARCELDVDRVVELQFFAAQFQCAQFVMAGCAQQVVEAEHARTPFLAHADHDLQLRQLPAAELAGLAVRKFRCQRAHHAEVVAALEGRGQHQGLAAGLVQRVFEFGQPVGRVDVHQHQTGLGGGVLGQCPFELVLRPDADARTGFEAEADKAAGQRVDAAPELGIGQAHTLVRHHQRFPAGVAPTGLVEEAADGLADQGFVRCAMYVACCGHAVSPANALG